MWFLFINVIWRECWDNKGPPGETGHSELRHSKYKTSLEHLRECQEVRKQSMNDGNTSWRGSHFQIVECLTLK